MSTEFALEPRRPGINRLALGAYALALVVVALDLVSKWWVLAVLGLDRRAPIAITPPWFRLTYVANDGVSYNLLRANGQLGRWLLVLFSLGVAVGLAVWAWRTVRALPAAGVGLVIGGAVGNALDRAQQGVVTDFLDFSGLHFPWVFNLADSAITVGVILLLAESVFAPKTP